MPIPFNVPLRLVGFLTNALNQSFDIAMYYAKESGHDNVKLFQKEMREGK